MCTIDTRLFSRLFFVEDYEKARKSGIRGSEGIRLGARFGGGLQWKGKKAVGWSLGATKYGAKFDVGVETGCPCCRLVPYL